MVQVLGTIHRMATAIKPYLHDPCTSFQFSLEFLSIASACIVNATCLFQKVHGGAFLTIF